MTTKFFKQIVNKASNAKSVVITLMAVVCLLFAFPQGASAGTKKYYYYYDAKLTVTSHNSTEGTVYISSSAASPSSGSATASLTKQDPNTGKTSTYNGGGAVSFYVYAIPAAGYQFRGWSSSNTTFTAISVGDDGLYSINAGTGRGSTVNSAPYTDYNYYTSSWGLGSSTTRYLQTNSVTIYAWFERIPPIVKDAGYQDYGEPRGLYDLGNLNKNVNVTIGTTTGTQSIVVQVENGMFNTDFSAEITNNGVGTFSNITKTLNAAGTELTVTFTYASGNTDGAIEAELLVSSTLNDTEYAIDIVGTVGNAKKANPLAWNIDGTRYINETFSLAEYLTNIYSDEPITVTSSDPTICEVLSNKTIVFHAAGNVTLRAQQSEGEEYGAADITLPITVGKRTATFNFSETTLLTNTAYPGLITCPQDADGSLMSLLTFGGTALSYMTVSGGDVTTGSSATNSVTLTITLSGNAEWNDINVSQTFKIMHPLPQPEFCLAGLNDMELRIADPNFIYQVDGTTGYGNFSWNSTNNVLHVYANNTGKYMEFVIHFDGVPNKINFSPDGKVDITIYESTNGTSWTKLYDTYGVAANTNLSQALSNTTRYVKLGFERYGSNTPTDINLNNLCITGRPSMQVSPTTITVYTDGETTTPATFNVQHNDLKSVTVTPANGDFTVSSPTVVSGEAIGANKKGTVSYTVDFNGSLPHSGTTLTVTGTGSDNSSVGSQTVTVNLVVVHATHYAKAQAEVIEAGTGRVFVSKNSTEPTSGYSISSSAMQSCSGEVGESDDLTFYYWSKPAEGFELEGWYNDAEMTSPANSAEHFSTTVHATSTDEAHPTTRTIYANFVESAAQDKPKFTIADLDLGSMVSCSGTTLTQNLVLQPEGEAIRPLYIDPDQISVSFSSAPGHGDEWQYFSKGDYVKGTKSFPIYFNQDCINPTTHTYQATATVTATNEFGTTTKSVLVSATITPAALAAFSVPSSLAFSTTLYSNQTQSLDAVLSSITNASGTPEISFSGTDASSFPAGDYDETNHKFVITFAPVAHKSYSATATITVRNCDNVETTHTITLTGGCQAAPAAAFTIGDHTFANKYRNQTDTWNATITGISNAYGDWTITKKSGDACITVGSVNQAAHTFVATFAPMAWGPYSATFTITFYNYDGVATSKDITLSGTCIEAPAADFTIGNHTFEDTQKNETDTWNATITGISNTYGDWTITKKSGDACITVGSVNQAAHTFVATFAPTAWGDYSATFTITFYNYDDVITSKDITLTGKCVHAPSAQFDLSATYHTFADRERGETDTWTVTLSNITNASATVIPAVTISGTDYAYFSAGEYDEGAKSFTITFEPLAVGGPYNATATVTMLNNDGDETKKTISLTGTCVPSPAATFDIHDAATSGTSVVNTSVYFGDFDPTEGNTKTFYLVNIANVKEGTVPTIELATSSEYILSAYNESTHSFTVSFTATDAMSGAQYGNISVSMVNNEGAKTTKSFSVSASIKEHAEFDVRVTDSGNSLIPNGETTWALGLALANANAGSTITLMRNVTLDQSTVKKIQDFTNDVTLDLNGYTLTVTNLNATYYTALRVNKANKTLTIKDSKTGGQVIASGARDNRLNALEVYAGNAILESGTLDITNTNTSQTTADRLYACAVYVVDGKTFTMNGGTLNAHRAARDAYGIYGAISGSSRAQIIINGGTINAYGNTYAYGLRGYCDFYVNGGTIHAETLTGAYAYGVYLRASANATASSGYYGTLTMTGGTIDVLSKTSTAYGVFADRSRAGTGTATAVDGTHCNQETGQITITGGNITVYTTTSTAYGITVHGSFSAKDNKHITTIIKNATIDVSGTSSAFGVYAVAEVTASVGACNYGDVELTNCNVTSTARTGGTAYGVYGIAAAGTSFKNSYPNYYGEYATAAKITINGGEFIANAATSGAYAVCTGTRARTTYGAETSVYADRTLGGAAAAYPELIIKGGTFTAHALGVNSDRHARAVSSGGNTTIEGGTFTAISEGRYARCLYGVAGKLDVTGATIIAKSNGRYSATNMAGEATGVFGDITIQTPTGFAEYCDITLKNCDITSSTVRSNTAYGVYLSCTSRPFTDLYLRLDSINNSWTHKDDGSGSYDIYKVIYPSGDRSVAAKATITGGKITAKTDSLAGAYGVYVAGPTFGHYGGSEAACQLTMQNVNLDVDAETSSAYGIITAGPSIIDNITADVDAKTTTACGIQNNYGNTVITNTSLDVTAGTGSAYGYYGQVGISSNTSATTKVIPAGGPTVTIIPAYNYVRIRESETEFGDGNDFDVKTTTGNTAYAIYLNASKSNWADAATYKNATGVYAYAARATVNGGKYTATAAGTTGYALGLAAKQVQGSAVAQPELTVNAGKFWGKATGGTDGPINANGQIGYCVLEGGYYNTATNLAPYVGEGKSVLPTPTGTAERTAGYNYMIDAGITGEVVCKVYQNGSTLRESYPTLEQAIQYVNANSGNTYTIVMVANYTLGDGNYVLPSKATLIVPESDTRKAAMGDTPTRETVSTPAPVQYLMLTFSSGVNMTVYGGIETTAKQNSANGGSAIAGAPTGNYGRLHLMTGSKITLENGSKFNCWGYCTGKGEITAMNGSTVREGFQLGYWRGGTATSSMLSYRNSWHAFPVTEYFIQNVESPILFRPGSQLLGYTSVNVSILGNQNANAVKLLGTSSSMFLMDTNEASADTWIRKEYDPATDRAIWTVNSGAKIGSFSFSLAGNTVNSADYYLPVSNNMTIYVNEGEFTITQDALLIPGAQIIISKLGKLTVSSGKRLFVMDNEDWPGFLKSGTTTVSRWYYNALYSPSWTSNPRTALYPPTTTRLPDGEIFVHGETEGQYYTSTHGANIHSTNPDAGKVKFISAAGANTSIQHVVNTDNERVTIDFTTAQLKNETPETPYTSSSVGTVAGEAFIYMESQWVKVTDGCLTTRTDGSGYHEYAHPSDAIEVVANGDNSYRDKASGTRYFINTIKPLTGANSDECVWWEVDPTPVVIAGTSYYVANQEKYDNYGTHYSWDGSAGYWKPKYVTVTWKNSTLSGGSTLDTYTQVPFNTSPKYTSASPSVPATTSTYKYAWTGWDGPDGFHGKDEVLPVAMTDVTYTAHIEESKWEYPITFKNSDNSVLETVLWEAGEIPSCSVTPTQAPTASTEYTFSGWNTTPVAVTGPATYTAQYTPTTRQYDVTFLDYDNTELHTEKVGYGSTSSYAAVPTRIDPTDTYLYDFVGWRLNGASSNGLQTVNGDQIYVAQYTSRLKWFTITFRDWDGSIIQSGNVLNGGTVTAPANPSRDADAQYVYSFTGWSPAFSATATESKTYTAQYDQSLNSYTIRFLNEGGAVLQNSDWEYGSTPSYSGATPTKASDAEYSYTFVGWDDIIRGVTGAKDYTAQYTPVLLDDGPYVDITDVDNSEHKLTLNVNSWPSNGWPYTVKYTNTATDATASASYDKGLRTAERQLIIPYAGDPGDVILITVKKNGGTLYSQHKYIVPTEVKTNTNVSTLSAKDLIYVKPGATLTINADAKSQNIYVAPDAKLVIAAGAKLSVDTLLLRTTAWASAEFENNGTLADFTQICYTRIISDKTQAYQFGLPMRCDLSSVRLSDGSTPVYGNGWLLRSYSESHRAYNGTGAGIDNWETLKETDKVIQATVGYEMFSNSNYYREYYFPVVQTRDASDRVYVSCSNSEKAPTMGPEHVGWNVITSPLMRRYMHDPVPEVNVSMLQQDGSYVQEPMTVIKPAIPFSYQAKASGYIYFDETMSVPTLASRRTIAASEEPERIQWIHLDLKDANEVGDQTSIYAHPTRYDESYQSGIDVAKQSFTATRALIYSSHAYGEMAFAGVSDASLEQGVALTVYNPTEQELTFSMRENDWLNRMAFVWLTDTETGAKVDLLESDYIVLVPAGTTRGRFYISGLFKAPQITTDNDVVQSDDEQGTKVEKLLINQKMYIKINGVLYDATGKKVNK